jgi:hypothetical protein
MRKIKSGDILIFNSTKPNDTFKPGDRVIFRGWMYLQGAKNISHITKPHNTFKLGDRVIFRGGGSSAGTVDFGSKKNMLCDISLFITLQELRENRINEVLKFSK